MRDFVIKSLNSTKNAAAILAVAAVAMFVQTAFAQTGATGTFIDRRDGQEYKTVKAGDNVWLAQNFNYAVDNGASCYNNDEANCDKFGKLYTWNAALAACPPGWRVPTRGDWDNLVKYVGGSRIVDVNGNVHWFGAGAKLKSKSGWNYNSTTNASGNGTDDLGFNALPGNWRDQSGNWGGFGDYAGFWTSEESSDGNAYSHGLNYDSDDFLEGTLSKNFGLSLRLVRDGSNMESDAVETETGDKKANYGEILKRIPKKFKAYTEAFGDGTGISVGDLNGDGIDDYVVAVIGTNKKKIVTQFNESCGEYTEDNNERGLLVFFADGSNNFRLALDNRKVLGAQSNGCDCAGDLWDVNIKKGSLFIVFNGCYSDEPLQTYNFKYRDSEFELIGYDNGESGRHQTVTSVNFLTKKKLVKECTLTSDDGRCRKYEETWSAINLNEKILLRNITNFGSLRQREF